ncbi:putative WRKY transcription factor 40 [Hordeum vulgare]|nr:putative WRKY transcription factor 40 [Hordeum vulgare]
MQAPVQVVLSGTVQIEEEDQTAGSTLPESFTSMQKPSVHECESPKLVRKRVSTGNPIARVALDMFDEMSQQYLETYLASMINENEDLTHVEYEMEEMAAFVIGATSDPNPTKKKKKGKTTKARGFAFSRFEDILLVKS